MAQRLRFFLALIILSISGCGNYKLLTASETFNVVFKEVVSGIFSKAAFDPIWEYYFGKSYDINKVEAVKQDFSQTVTNVIIESVIPSAQASEKRFECNTNESNEDCKNRLSIAASKAFDIYAPIFLESFKKCRDSISYAGDFTENVRSINECLINKGFEREIKTILRNIKN